mgnify:CR=1 FL=1
MLVEFGKPFFRAAVASVRWAKSGFATVDANELNCRKEICRNCTDWDAEAMYGVGRCNVCGCSSLKLKLITEKCPKGKW